MNRYEFIGNPYYSIKADADGEWVRYDVAKGLYDALSELSSSQSEEVYRRVMADAPCHSGIFSIDRCGRCSRELRAIRALKSADEGDENW